MSRDAVCSVIDKPRLTSFLGYSLHMSRAAPKGCRGQGGLCRPKSAPFTSVRLEPVPAHISWQPPGSAVCCSRMVVRPADAQGPRQEDRPVRLTEDGPRKRLLKCPEAHAPSSAPAAEPSSLPLVPPSKRPLRAGLSLRAGHRSLLGALHYWQAPWRSHCVTPCPPWPPLHSRAGVEATTVRSWAANEGRHAGNLGHRSPKSAVQRARGRY